MFKVSKGHKKDYVFIKSKSQIFSTCSSNFRGEIQKPLLAVFGDEVKKKILEISKTSRFEIDTMEVDQNHIHLLVKYEPNISISRIVERIKQGTTYHLWQRHPNRLRLEFWKKNTFWSPSYFACSVGKASDETIRKYIEEQG